MKVIGLIAFIVFTVFFLKNIVFDNESDVELSNFYDINTEQGIVRGFASKHDTITFQGIPFASPPIEELRWKAPTPPIKRSDVLIANNNDTVCLQRSGSVITFGLLKWRYMIGSEDCLYLNIVMPNDIKPDEKLPVMVWLHGGGRSKGDKGDKDYAGEHFVNQGRVILVNVNHRLGPLGWFLHPALVATSDSLAEKSGNFGTLDIIESLNWVRSNIQNFGGDSENITLFGVSTGASNTLSLVLSPLAAGLFDKAIVQSGVYRPVTQAFASLPASEGGHVSSASEIVNKVLVESGQAKNAQEAWQLQKNLEPQALVHILKNYDPEKLISFYSETDTVSGMLDFPSLNRDGFVIPYDDPQVIFENNKPYNAMPLMFGSNRDENKIFMAFDLKYVSIPEGIRDLKKYNRHAKYYSDNWKLNSVDKVVRPLSDLQAVYVYRFDWDKFPKIGWIDFSELIGAGHILETPFIFTKQHKRKRKALSDAMIYYWSNFAYTGSPNVAPADNVNPSLPYWSPWKNEVGAKKFIILDTGESGIKMSNKELTFESLKQRLITDPDIEDATERCELYQTMFIPEDANHFDYAEYSGLGCH